MSRTPTIFSFHGLLATWFGSGLLPKAPGTWGTLAALPFAWVIQAQAGPLALGLATVLVFFVGIGAANKYMAETGTHDPGAIVIDEVAGVWLVLVIVPNDWMLYGLAFLFFRIADIFKPWPACWADKNVHGGLGVMLDDILAGIWAMVGIAAVMAFRGDLHVF